MQAILNQFATVVDLPLFGVLGACGFLFTGLIAERLGSRDSTSDRHFVVLTATLFAAVTLLMSWLLSYITRPELTGLRLPSASYIVLRGDIWIAVFALGCALVLLRLLVGTVRVEWIIRRGVVAPEPVLKLARGVMYDLRVAGELGRDVRVLMSNRCESPFVAGVLRKTVVLPWSAAGLDREALTSILTHEFAHVIRRDPLAQLGCQAATALLWWNPLLWRSLRRINLLREMACDDIATWRHRRVDSYIELLSEYARGPRLRLVGNRLIGFLGGGLIGGLGFSQIRMASRSTIDERVRAMRDAGDNFRGWPSLFPSHATRADVLWASAISVVILTVFNLWLIAAVTPEVRQILIIGEAY